MSPPKEYKKVKFVPVELKEVELKEVEFEVDGRVIRKRLVLVDEE